VALNMSGTSQKISLDLKRNGFASAKSLLATVKSAAKDSEVTLEPFGVFIGELAK
jgi:hypothetical protein